MPRRTSQTYICKPLSDLAAQLLRSPESRRLEQMHRAERLHDDIDPATNYPFSFIVFRLTETRPTLGVETIHAGEALRPDLRLLIDQLSRSLDLYVEDDTEPIWRLDALAQHANVSTKTLQRWRKEGLRWRLMRIAKDKPHQPMITESAWRHFSSKREDLVTFAANFTQISAKQKQQILDEARGLAADENLRLNQVATRLSRKHERGLETIRMMLQKHDEQNPKDAIFKNHTGPIDARQRRVITRAYRMGMTVADLAKHFQRTTHAIYRILYLERASHLLKRDVHFIASPLFERDDAETVLLRQSIDDLLQDALQETSSTGENIVLSLPPVLQPLYNQQTLDDDHARSLLVRYNFLKHQYHSMQQQLDRKRPSVRDMDRMDDYWKRAIRVRQAIVRHHLPIVHSIARRQLIGLEQPSPRTLFTLLEQGNVELFELVEIYNSRLRLTFASVLRNRSLGRYAREMQTHNVGEATKRHAARRDEATRCLHRMIQTARTYGIDLETIVADSA